MGSDNSCLAKANESIVLAITVRATLQSRLNEPDTCKGNPKLILELLDNTRLL
jgi:hypothetical protein